MLLVLGCTYVFAIVASRGRPGAPTPVAGELKRIVADMVDDNLISTEQARLLHNMIAAEDEYVFAAYEVYEEDPNHDLVDLRDTLQRIVRLTPLRGRVASITGPPAASGAQLPTGYPGPQLKQIIVYLLRHDLIHSCASCARAVPRVLRRVVCVGSRVTGSVLSCNMPRQRKRRL